MDEVEQDQHEARLKELFDSFDTTGTGSLGQEELTDLCHMLSLEEVAPVLQQTLLQDNLLGRVHFDQFKEALILILSRTLSNEEHFQEPDCSPEAQPKYVRGGKRYGRRSLPEFQESVEEFAEVTVIEPVDEARPSHIPAGDCNEHWKTQHSEEYEAEGQLRFWNPDDLNASQGGSCPPQDWIEEKLQEVCEDLGITRDGHLNRKKLVSICEQYGLQNVDGEMLEEVFHNLDPDGTMSVEDFFYGLFKNGKSLTPSASTPYRQLKRHLSMQSFDESGRRTTTSSVMTSTIGFRVFSCLDDGMGHASVERILDTWQEEGIENSQEILKALDFNLDGNVNLTELTLALENELLVTKNGIHQAALASFKAEIRHLLERVEQVVREKEKLRSDLDKAEKLKSLMASEVDDHHAAIERRNEYNLRKLDEEYKERIAALKNELRKEREQILQQVGKQRLELEQEIEKAKTEENYIRDRLALSLKENSRLENELLENAEKLAEYENLTNKLQRNLDNVLAEKFGDLDPSSAEFFLQEERLTQMRSEYERQCRVLQDQVDELQSELEEYRAQGKVFKLPVKNSLSEELDVSNSGLEPDQGLESEECNPLNMSIEAELVIEQMKEQHHRDLCRLRQELEDQVHHHEEQLAETRATWEKEQATMKENYEHGRHALEEQISDLRKEIVELQGQAEVLKDTHHETCHRQEEEKKQLQTAFEEEKTRLREELRLQHELELQARLQQAEEGFSQEKEGLQSSAWTEERVRGLLQDLERAHREQLQNLGEKHELEKEELRQELLDKHQRELQKGREEMETECNRRASQIEAQFQADRERVTARCEDALQSLEGRHRRELQDLQEQWREERSQWEFEKDELAQECTEAQERLKETLQREKATSLVLTQEREMLEKTYKEHLNSMVLERERLLQDLEDLRKVSESQRSLLSSQILELKSSHERELRDREQVLSQAGPSEQLASGRLERLREERDPDREKQEMLSRLAAVESAHRATQETAERQRAEMGEQIRRLREEVQDLQRAASPASRLLGGCQASGGEKAEGDGALSLVQQGEQLLEENGDVLLSLQRAHERAVKENVTMAAEISRLQHRLQKLEPGLLMSSCLEQPATELFGNCAEHSEPFLLQNQRKRLEGGTMSRTLSDLQVGEVGDLGSTGTSSAPRQGLKTEESEASMESFSELENSEETRTESWDLKNQVSQLQQQLVILRADCDRASEKKQDLLFDVSTLKKKLKMLERIPEVSPQYKLLYEDASRENDCLQEELRVMETCYDQALESNRELTTEVFRLQDELKKVEEVTETYLSLEKSYEEVRTENKELNVLVLRLQGKVEELQESAAQQCGSSSFWEASLDDLEVKAAEQVLELGQRLEKCMPKVMRVGHIREECKQGNQCLEQRTTRLLEKAKTHEISLLHRTVGTHQEKPRTQNQVILERNSALLGQDKHFQRQATIAELELEKQKLQELTRKLRERVTTLVKQRDVPCPAEKEEELKAMMHDLQSTCSEMQQKVEVLRYESEKLQEENSILRSEITTLNEEDSISNMKLNGSQEELWQKIETVEQEKVEIQKMVETLKKQISDLKIKNQQLDSEKTELSQKNSENQEELQELNQRLAEMQCQEEQEPGSSTFKEWGQEKSDLKKELEHYKVQSSTLVSSLEAELSQAKIQTHTVEQENLLLKDELEKMKQLHRGPDLSDFQQKISSVLNYNERLLREKEALSEELKSCVDKLAKSRHLEHKIAAMKQEHKSWEHQSESLKSQLAESQEKVRDLEDTLQNVNLQLSRVKSDLQGTQQEKEALKQEVISLQKHLQSAGDKNWAPETATHPSGPQSQQKRLSWQKLDHLMNEEQQLLWQENERLQSVVQHTKAELSHSREKVRQLESSLLPLKHQKQLNPSGTVKLTEQEKLNLKRECEEFQTEPSPSQKKVSQMNALERELETIHLENEGLKKKQVKLDEQLVEMQDPRSTVMHSLSAPWDLQPLQQQACPVVPREHFLQLQHQLLQAERRNQHLQEELDNRASNTNMPQGSQEQLVTLMEERMIEVEEKLKLVKRLLQEKVNQLKEQLCKNTKADAVVKDLYVENAQLLKALEMTEQRQKTAEKKNYLLEEKIASLSNIVRNLTPAPLTCTPPLRS